MLNAYTFLQYKKTENGSTVNVTQHKENKVAEIHK